MFSKLTVKNRLKIDCIKSVRNKWWISSTQERQTAIYISRPPEDNAAISRNAQIVLAPQQLEQEKVQNMEKKEYMIMRDDKFATIIQQQEEG